MTTDSGGNADVLPGERRSANAELQTPSVAWPPTRSPEQLVKGS